MKKILNKNVFITIAIILTVIITSGLIAIYGMDIEENDINLLELIKIQESSMLQKAALGYESICLLECNADINDNDIVAEKVAKEYANKLSYIYDENNGISYDEDFDLKQWFIEYKAIFNKYADYLDPPETIYDYFSDEEINLIHRVIETECFSSDFESKVHIANVIFNRYELCEDEFGKTITDIITKKNQFDYSRTEITQDTVLACEFAFSIADLTNGCLFFHSNPRTERFCGCEYAFTDKAEHHFYKKTNKKLKEI